MEVNYFFFYGSFMSGYPQHEKFLKPYTISVQKAQTNGSLYHLPCGSPTMAVGENIIKGEIMLLKDTNTMLAYLDMLKGYYGQGRDNHHDRIVQLVEVEKTREKLLAYIYVCPGYRLLELETKGVIIPDGDWQQFMGDLRQTKEEGHCCNLADA